MKTSYKVFAWGFGVCMAGFFVLLAMLIMADAGVRVARECFGSTPTLWIYFLALAGFITCFCLAWVCCREVKNLPRHPANRWKRGRKFDPPPEPDQIEELVYEITPLQIVVLERELN